MCPLQEVYYGALESSGDGLLGAIEHLLSDVFIPALSSHAKWGKLKGPDGEVVKQAFLSKLSLFAAVLSNARASIADAVKLSPCADPVLAAIISPSEILAAAHNSDVVEAAEKCTQLWCREIEQTLTQSEQMRKEADDVGPRAELEHWKKRMAKFDSLTTSVKTRQCRAVINVLVAAKSKVLQVRHTTAQESPPFITCTSPHLSLQSWKDLDIMITDFTNEAKDNVKFLYTLERYCEPLYKCNPVGWRSSAVGLVC